MAEDFRYTFSMKREGGEMFVIRSNEEDDLLERRDSLKAALSLEEDDRPKKDYKHEGDQCPNCEGTLVIRQGTNRGNKASFNFLGCSRYPACQYTSYISKFKKEVKEAAPQTA